MNPPTSATSPRRGSRRGRLLAAALLTLAASSIALRADVLLEGTQPADGSGDPAFPAFLDATAPGTLDAPSACTPCHAGYREFGQRIHEPYDSWAGSLMANAGRDPLFWAALDVANQDDARHLGDVGVGDFCLRCHAPTAWYEGRSSCDTPWGERFDGACLQGSPGARNDDFEGLTCAFCHRMYDASNAPPGEYPDALAPYDGNGRVYLSTTPDTLDGPFSDSVPERHEARYSPFHTSPALCGQCHDVTNPARNQRDPVTGADLGRRMPIERTYREYVLSVFNDATAPEHETCQSCHMPEPDLDGDGTPDPAYACVQAPGLRGPGQPLEGPMRTHFFAGASAWMQGVLRDELGAELRREEQFDAAIEATLDVLTTRTATAALTAPPDVTAGTPLDVSVRVTNLTGHKLPTGYPEGRRAWIHVAAGEDLDGDGLLQPAEVTFESGSWDALTGDLAVDPQLALYEIKLGVWDYNGTGRCDVMDDATGKPMFHFVLNDCIVEDPRIPPLGFVPDVETAPVGHVYPDNPARPGTLANWDDRPYSIPVSIDATEPFVVETNVLYQSTSREYVEFLRDESESTCDPTEDDCDPTQPDARANRGEKMHALWERYDRCPPIVVASARVVVPVAPAPTGACCLGGSCFTLTSFACDEQAGEYRGDGTDCATEACGVTPGPPPGEASNVPVGAAPLLVTSFDRATGDIALAWSPACDATDHGLTWGELSDVALPPARGLACSVGTSGVATFRPGPGSVFFLVVGRSNVAEGSHGRDSFGVERPESLALAPCDFPQDLTATCG